MQARPRLTGPAPINNAGPAPINELCRNAGPAPITAMQARPRLLILVKKRIFLKPESMNINPQPVSLGNFSFPILLNICLIEWGLL